MTPEARLLKKIREFLKPYEKSGEAFVVKIVGGALQRPGLPDLHLIYRGRSFWLEVKAGDNTATPLQEATMRRIRAAGGIAEVVRSVEEVERLLGLDRSPAGLPDSMGAEQVRKEVERCNPACRVILSGNSQ